MSLIPFLLVLVLFAGALIFLLYWVLTRNVTDATGHLEALSQESLKKQEALKQKLEESEKLQRQTLAKATQEAEALRQKAAQEVEAEKKRLLDEARREGERIIQKATQSEEAMRQEWEERLGEEALKQACLLLENTLPEAIRKKLHEAWLEELVSDGLAFDQFKDAPEGEVVLTSAFPLTPKQRDAIKIRLKGTLKREVSLEETVDPTLVAGLLLSCGSLVLDGSLRFRIRTAAQERRYGASGE